MLKNNLQRKNNRWDLIGMILAAAGSAVMVVGLCVAFYGGAYFFLTKDRASWMALLYWAIFLWCQVVPILVAGFGANFEFRNLLRFPLSLRTFYILGVGYGFADFAAVSSLCWIASMLVATAVGRAELLPAMMVVSLLFVLVNVTLERLIGSWLEGFSNRRARNCWSVVCALGFYEFSESRAAEVGDAGRDRESCFMPFFVVAEFAGGNAIAATSNAHSHAAPGSWGLLVAPGQQRGLLGSVQGTVSGRIE
jgi:hypothetical protein